MGIEAGDDYEEYRTSGLHISRPFRWLLCIGAFVGAVAMVIAAFLVFVSFDRWRRDWWAILLRLTAIPTLIFLAFHAMWLGLSLVGA